MNYKRLFRYLAPNLITTASLAFGMLALADIVHGDYVSAGWYIIYAVLTDRLDGLVARLVRGTSEFGVQLDSFADFLNFGVAPALLMYTSLGSSPLLPFQSGSGRYLLMAACACWLLANTFRLARYNIMDEVPAPAKIKLYFGVPTTLAGGILVIWYLMLCKYSPEGAVFPLRSESFGGVHLVDAETPLAVWRYFPVAMLVLSYLMVSNLRLPRLGVMGSKPVTIFILVNVAIGYICGFARMYPDYMFWMPTSWVIIYLAWGIFSPTVRGVRPPPVFPVDEPSVPGGSDRSAGEEDADGDEGGDERGVGA